MFQKYSGVLGIDVKKAEMAIVLELNILYGVLFVQ